MRDKKAVSTLMVIFGIGVLLALGVIGYGVYQSTAGGGGALEEKKLTGDCDTEPYLDQNIIDRYDQSTTLTVDTFLKEKDGTYIGNATSSTKLTFGKDYEVILSKGDYIDRIVQLSNVKCGANPINEDLSGTDAVTMAVIGSGNSQLANAYNGDGSGNETASASTIINTLRLSAPTDKETGELTCVAQANQSNLVDKITASGSGVSATSIPDVNIDVPGSKTETTAFKVASIKDGARVDVVMNLVPVSGQTINDVGFNITCYSAQAFVEKDGTFVTGVENVDGTAKFEDKASTAYFIT